MKYLSFIDGSALQYALETVQRLPPGTMFTTKKLFEGIVILDADSRCKGAIARELERCKIIDNVGSTTRDQENRHHGLTTLWRRI